MSAAHLLFLIFMVSLQVLTNWLDDRNNWGMRIHSTQAIIQFPGIKWARKREFKSCKVLNCDNSTHTSFPLDSFLSCFSSSSEDVLLTYSLKVRRWLKQLQTCHHCWLSLYYRTVFNLCSLVVLFPSLLFLKLYLFGWVFVFNNYILVT